MAVSVKQILISSPYKEESVKVPVAITVLLLVLIITPLVFWILRINDAGVRSSDVSKFDKLITKVEVDILAVDAFLNNNGDALEALRRARETPVVTLIVPEVVIIDEQKQGTRPLKINLDGIYWNPSKPLVSIDGETYGIGDVIQGHEIIQIGKTVVQFRAQDGTIIEKDMYGDLLKGSKR